MNQKILTTENKKELIKGLDYYIDKNSGNLVVTEEYHLNRGYCCESNCRHCPYE